MACESKTCRYSTNSMGITCAEFKSIAIRRPLYPTHFVDQFINENVLKTHDEINLCLEDKKGLV
jgi:hypothetical protein